MPSRLSLPYLIIACILAIPASAALSVAPPALQVTGERKITANFEEVPLGEVLRMMAARQLLEVKGPVPGNDTVSARFSDLTLNQAVKKLMRGYNYVLVDRGPFGKPRLILMGKIDAGRQGPQGPQRGAESGPWPPSASRSLTLPAAPSHPETQAVQPIDRDSVERSYVPPVTVTPPPPEPTDTKRETSRERLADNEPGERPQREDQQPGQGQDGQPDGTTASPNGTNDGDSLAAPLPATGR